VVVERWAVAEMVVLVVERESVPEMVVLVVERESVPEMVVLVVEGESVPEMVVYLNHLMWPLAQEDCIGCWCIPEECLNGRWWEACLVHELH
jgi:hypothetical protein